MEKQTNIHVHSPQGKPSGPFDVKKELSAAVEHHQAGRLEKAKAIYERILLFVPGQPDALQLLGLAAFSEGNHDKAIELIEGAIAVKPQNSLYYYNLGTVFHENGRLDEALDCYKKTLEFSPNYFKALVNAGNIFSDRGQEKQAIEHYKRALALNPDNADVNHNTGILLFNTGKEEEAVAYFERAISINPNHAQAYHAMGNVYLKAGKNELAKQCYQNSLTIDPDFRHAKISLAVVNIPGENYVSLLNRLHHFLQPENYIEIGVATGTTLTLAKPPTLAIGIDPQPRIEHPFQAPTRIHAMTSDDFFATLDVYREIDGRAIAFAFIDGLHLFEQILKDFINVERHAAENSVVLFHDTLPIDALTCGREKIQPYWCGDSWKIIPILKKYRPELNIYTIAANPTGLSLVTGLDPESRILEENYETIVKEFFPVTFEYLSTDRNGILNVIPSHWPDIQHIVETMLSKPFALGKKKQASA